MAYTKTRLPERVYVKVNSDFDSTGFMQPRSITWKDGRVFKIDAVKDFKPASSVAHGLPGRLLHRSYQGRDEASVF